MYSVTFRQIQGTQVRYSVRQLRSVLLLSTYDNGHLLRKYFPWTSMYATRGRVLRRVSNTDAFTLGPNPNRTGEGGGGGSRMMLPE